MNSEKLFKEYLGEELHEELKRINLIEYNRLVEDVYVLNLCISIIKTLPVDLSLLSIYLIFNSDNSNNFEVFRSISLIFANIGYSNYIFKLIKKIRKEIKLKIELAKPKLSYLVTKNTCQSCVYFNKDESSNKYLSCAVEPSLILNCRSFTAIE
jgi:hypothetical protein